MLYYLRDFNLMNSKKVLILGVTHPQIDAILYCKSQKYEVHGLSYHREGVGLPYLDYFSKIDIADRDSVLDYTRENKIDLVYSTGSDIALPTIAYVSKKLGLPLDINYDQAMLLMLLAISSQLMSFRITWIPDWAHTWDIPPPIKPAPTINISLIHIAYLFRKKANLDNHIRLSN